MQERNFFELELKNNSWSHAYLVIGKNKDKTKKLIDYIIEKNGCIPADISEVVPEESSGKKGEIKIEQIKELLHQTSLSPLGSCRIGVIYNAEKLNQSSSNMLLKTLEEPSGNVIFILASENSSVLPTIKSRCRVIQVRDDLEIQKNASEYEKILSLNFVEASQKFEKIIKDNEIEPLLDDLENFYREKLLKEKKEIFAKAIYEIEKKRKEIAGNANPRLALESLYLMLESKNQ